MRGDQPRLWAQAVERADSIIDRIDIGDGSGGFMEPSVSIHVGTVMWLDHAIQAAKEFLASYREEPLGRVAAARYSKLEKALELDATSSERGSTERGEK